MATLRYDIDEAQAATHLEAFQKIIVPSLVSSPGIGSVSLLVADRAASGYVNAEQRARGAANLVPPIVLLVEGWANADAFATLVHTALEPQALARHALSGTSSLGIYSHQLTLLGKS
jgi:hypothetical protein